MNPLRRGRIARRSESFQDPRQRIATATSVIRARAEANDRLERHGRSDVLEERLAASLDRLENVARKLEDAVA